MSDKAYKPIYWAGILFLLIGVVSVILFFFMQQPPSIGSTDFSFIVGLTSWHVITGLGVVLKKHWGLVLLKVYLYVLMIGFPIGTYIAIKGRKYIQENNFG